MRCKYLYIYILKKSFLIKLKYNVRSCGDSAQWSKTRILYSCRVIIFGSYFMVLALNVTLTRKINRIIYTIYATYIHIYTLTQTYTSLGGVRPKRSKTSTHTSYLHIVYAHIMSLYIILLYMCCM